MCCNVIFLAHLLRSEYCSTNTGEGVSFQTALSFTFTLGSAVVVTPVFGAGNRIHPNPLSGEHRFLAVDP